MLKNRIKSITKIFFLIICLLFLLSSRKTVIAAVRCETQYGGGEVCVRTGNLQVDKLVWNNSNDKLFVDNTDTMFASGEEVRFKIKVKNVGDATFDKVYVKDTLPSFLELVSGSLSYEISDLSTGEEDVREIITRVVSDNRFPSSGNSICDVNTVKADSGNEHDENTARLCVGKNVLGISTLPKAGPDNWESIIILSAIFGLIGATGLCILYLSKN